jgi:hypothetical protein
VVLLTDPNCLTFCPPPRPACPSGAGEDPGCQDRQAHCEPDSHCLSSCRPRASRLLLAHLGNLSSAATLGRIPVSAAC